MNAEYYKDLFNSLEKMGADLSKVSIRGKIMGPDGELNLPATGLTVIDIAANSEGTITIEFK